jgi:hypothetical protein
MTPKKRAAALFLIAGLTVSAQARDALGVFDGWGAFRDTDPARCFAIAEPIESSGGKWRPFASVAHWPGKGVRGQLHIRLSREKRSNANVTLVIDERRWRLVAGKTDAWSPSPQHDAFILAKMRSGRAMSVSSVAATGGGFADTYRLKGAATAIDAAALGCARAR